ncbi:hypothetical protein BGW36DRAFT_438990 [Talaromyces proteolyticus]|uniref:Zn(2)-C6 fungal-type domain-containing protein n=1 Tax=Talaromyces proteolyticus TaxID=1131652 RepID=A0AAD4PWC9_9EURO|nr:uncharacterized protein BGW36DRAFT_438990 [Talaromyces proteolyticus]KAH8691389.1 hypothetical protein BGW36DRAFT_438990 [Talaromyces proteolyticus]
MSDQICIRCRKRKIRCDLQLPSCKNCKLADVECLFWDDSLGQKIPCSYLHSLRQKVLGLKSQIETAQEQCRGSSNDLRANVESTQSLEYSYHLRTSDCVNLKYQSRQAYLGPGNSARLIERHLNDAIHWHLVNNIQLPKSLLPDEISQFPFLQEMAPHDSNLLWPYSLTSDQRRSELHSLVPPSTQRAIIEHYFETVSPEYTLLSPAQESMLRGHENPLRWSSMHKNDPGAMVVSIVFAISAALITRDLDPSLSYVATHCREDLHKVHQRVVSPMDPIEAPKRTCMTLCGLVLCELICPVSGKLWDLLGRAISTLDHLQEAYRVINTELDEDFWRLERSLLKLESCVALHLRRPSHFCEIRLWHYLDDFSTSNNMSNELKIMSHLHNITQRFFTLTFYSERLFEKLIPRPLQIDSIDSDIDIQSATLYAALHPLFTTTNVWSTGKLEGHSFRLFHIIARSAATIITHIAYLNEKNKIISIWMAAERVLELGVVWAAYLLYQKTTTTSSEKHIYSNMGMSTAISPILKVSALLASFNARWKRGSAYVAVWETFVELLWNML